MVVEEEEVGPCSIAPRKVAKLLEAAERVTRNPRMKENRGQK